MAALLLLPFAAAADSIDLGLAGQYAVFGLGSAIDVGTADTLGANTARIYGNVAVGADRTSASADGNATFQKGFIDGDLYIDGPGTPASYTIVNKNFSVSGTVFGTAPDNPGPHPNSVGTGTFDLSAAVQDAVNRSLFYAGLPSTNLGNFSFGSGTHTLSAGIYSATNFLINSHTTFVINGDPDDIFVLNVSGGFDFTKSYMQLTGGITAANVLFNVTGTGTDAKITGDDSIFFGTLLADYRNISIQGIGSGSAQGVGFGIDGIAGTSDDNTGLSGRVIGALGTTGSPRLLKVYSGAEDNMPPISPVPEPSSMLLLASGLALLAARRRGKAA